MKIRFKVKHLLISLLVAGVLFFLLIPRLLLHMGDRLEKGYRYEKAASLYSAGLHVVPPPYREKFRLLRAKSILRRSERVTIFRSGGWAGSGAPPSAEDLRGAKRDLEEILESGSRKRRAEVYRDLLDCCMAMGETKELKERILWGAQTGEAELGYSSDLYAAYIDLANRKTEEAYERLKKYGDSPYREGRYIYLMRLLGHYDEEIAENPDPIPEERIFGGSGTLSVLPNQGEDFIRGGQYRLSGKLLCEGEPIPFVPVIATRDLNSFRSGGEYFPLAITGEDGSFVTLPIQGGSYDLAVQIPSFLLYDKMYLSEAGRDFLFVDGDEELSFDFARTFEVELAFPAGGIVPDEKTPFTLRWDAVSGAKEYRIEMGTMYSGKGEDMVTHITEIGEMEAPEEGSGGRLEFTSSVAEVNRQTKMRSWSEEGPAPANILGAVIGGGRQIFDVKALDESGRLIASSRPLLSEIGKFPAIVYTEQLSEGEKYFVQREYQKGIDYYEALLRKEPENEKALRYLIACYGRDEMKNEEGPLKYEPFEDPKRAYELILRYYELTGDESEVVDMFGNVDFSLLTERRKEVEALLSSFNDPKAREEALRLRARIAETAGDLKAAYRIYAAKQDGSVDEDLAYYEIYFGETEKAKRRIETSERLFLHRTAAQEWAGAIGRFGQAKDAEEKRRVQELIGEYLRKGRSLELAKAAKSLREDLGDPDLRYFMEVLGREWDVDFWIEREKGGERRAD